MGRLREDIVTCVCVCLSRDSEQSAAFFSRINISITHRLVALFLSQYNRLLYDSLFGEGLNGAFGHNTRSNALIQTI